MDEYIVVDGYNVIFSWPELEDLKQLSLACARDRLVHILADYVGYSGHRVLVIFDAHQVDLGLDRYQRLDGVEVYYTRVEETADAMIEKLVGQLPRDDRIWVVTSDWDEQRIIFGRGAYRMTPGELYERVSRYKRRGQKTLGQPNQTEGYLENRLTGQLRGMFEQWRRKKE